MPYSLNSQGITIASQAELVATLQTQYYAIYGPQIDVSPSSQDGQQIQIYVQAQLDVAAIILNCYDSRDANQATGTQLDSLFWWLPRQGGSNTIQNLTVITNAATTLYGMNQTAQPVFTYADPVGNQYQLQTTQSPSGAGTYVYVFQAVNPGSISSALNTITTAVTVNLAITSVNNPTTYTTLGQNEETDFAYRLRGLASTAIASQGFFGSLFAALGIVPANTSVILYENYLQSVSTGTVPPGIPAGIPGNCIWAIVSGSATPVNIATAIYNQRSEGCNMKGAQFYNITQPDGSLFTIFWDNILTENIYVQATASSVNGITPPNLPALLAQLPAILTFKPGQVASIGEVSFGAFEIDPNTLLSGIGLSSSSSGPFTSTLSPTAGNYEFEVAQAQIFLLPMQLLPLTSTVAPTVTVQFSAYGGYGTNAFSISVNNSGGTINSSTGLYTAGSTPGTDTILVTDVNSNTATAQVTVT